MCGRCRTSCIHEAAVRRQQFLADQNCSTLWRQGREWGRLLWSGLLHADDMHIYYNMASFLWKVQAAAVFSFDSKQCRQT